MIKKLLATFMSCFILVSLIVIFYWRDIQYQPEQHDLINYFLLLPLLISIVLLSPWLIYRAYKKYQDKKQQALNVQQQQAVSVEHSIQPEKSVCLGLNIYAAGAYSVLGENEAILEGMKQFTSPQLDQQLLNHQGLPILSYRIEELDQYLNTEEPQDEWLASSTRQQRIMAMIQHQIHSHTELLYRIAEHLKRSSLFYESQNLHEYRMHPAWIDPTLSTDDIEENRTIEPVYRLDKLNLHLLLSEDLLHRWDDQQSQEQLEAVLYDLGVIPQKFHIEYHFVSHASANQYLAELLQRIQKKPHEVSLLFSVDSEIDQEVVDEKIWPMNPYIPAEFIGSCCVAHPQVQLEDVAPLKTLTLVLNQSHLLQTMQDLEIQDLPQYVGDEPFVLVTEDGADHKTVKKLTQFFANSPVEQQHYLYCLPTVGHTHNLAKIFAMMLGTHFPDEQVAFVYGHDLQAFIQAIPEVEQAQEDVALAG